MPRPILAPLQLEGELFSLDIPSHRTQGGPISLGPRKTLSPPNFLGNLVDEFLPPVGGGKVPDFSSSWEHPLADLSLRVFRGLAPAAELILGTPSRKPSKG